MNHVGYGSFATPQSFIKAVLELRPRIAAFDCDGTLWYGDSGMKFLYWEIDENLISKSAAVAILRRYDEYLAGKVSEDEMCGEMVQIHSGLPEKRIREFAERFVHTNVIPQIFPEMKELVSSLHEAGSDVWAVSSTNNWVIEAAVRTLDIPAQRVLAVGVEIEDGVATDKLGEMTSGPGKARALRRVLSQPLGVSFGNSIFDLDMLELAHTAFPVNPNDDLREIAEQRGWKFYQPALAKLTAPTL